LTEADRFNGIKISLIRQVINDAPPGSVNMALGELGYAMPEYLRQEAHKLLDSGTASYTPNAGLNESRQAVADYYGDKYGVDNVCVTNGAEEAIFLSLFALSNPGQVVAIPDPDYTAYASIASLLGTKTVRLPFQPDLETIDWDKWESQLSQKVIFLLLSNPQNPSGKYFNNKELSRLSSICNRYRITVLVDEIYRELWFTEKPPSTAVLFDHVVHIGGLSKSHCLSGWRIGWAVSSREVISSITKAKQYVSTCSNWLAQKLIPAALSEKGLRGSEMIRLRLMKDREKTITTICEFLSHDHLHTPQATPYLMLKVEDDLQAAKELSTLGLISVPGRAFGSVTRGWIRLNYAVSPESLNRGIEILRRYYSEYRK